MNTTTPPTSPLKLSLGPILHFWSKEQVLSFYQQAATWPVDIIYLGETICARRHEMRTDDWIVLAKELQASGKEIVLSSQALLESEIDLRRLRKLAEEPGFTLEANDLGAAKLARDQKKSFIIGTSLNVYNEETLAFFQQLGATRWVAPIEMTQKKIAAVMQNVSGIECEIFGWGNMPLAYSARCFTARHYNLRKDLCEFKCKEHPDGMLLKTRENEPFLTINGTQTMSAGNVAFIAHAQELHDSGVHILRISPQSQHMAEIVQIHSNVLQGKLMPQEAMEQLKPLACGALVDGFWRGLAGAVEYNKATI